MPLPCRRGAELQPLSHTGRRDFVALPDHDPQLADAEPHPHLGRARRDAAAEYGQQEEVSGAHCAGRARCDAHRGCAAVDAAATPLGRFCHVPGSVVEVGSGPRQARLAALCFPSLPFFFGPKNLLPLAGHAGPHGPAWPVFSYLWCTCGALQPGRPLRRRAFVRSWDVRSRLVSA